MAEVLAQREAFFESKKSELKLFESKLVDKIDSHSAELKETEKAMIGLINDRTNDVKIELVKEAAVREESVDILRETLEVHFFCICVC